MPNHQAQTVVSQMVATGFTQVGMLKYVTSDQGINFLSENFAET